MSVLMRPEANRLNEPDHTSHEPTESDDALLAAARADVPGDPALAGPAGPPALPLADHAPLASPEEPLEPLTEGEPADGKDDNNEPDEDDDDEPDASIPPNDKIVRRTSTTAVHKAAAAFARHQLPQRGAMARKLSWLVTTVLGWVFTRVDFGERPQETIKAASDAGQIVYVFHTRSALDYIYFNWALIQHKLPLSSFVNDLSMMVLHPVRVYIRHLLHRRSRRQRDYQLAAFDYHLGCGDPLGIFLNKPRSDTDENLQFSQSYLVRLMEVHQRTEKPVLVLPLLVVWDKRPDSSQPTLVDEFFGSSQSPGFFRKAFQFLNMSWQSFFVFGTPIVTVGEPVQLNEFRTEYPEADMAEAAELLRDRLESAIAQERQVIMGPPLKQNRAIKAEVMRKPDLVDQMREVASQEGVSELEIRRRGAEQLDEIAADFNLLGIKTLGAILSPIFYLIYRGFHVDEEGLHRLRATARDSRVILVPSHKSYIDFLVLSYVFYQRGLIPPHIAAGVNLSFWPLGPLFRRCGAFFLRRSFKGDPIYGSIFKTYVVKLLEEGFMIEFFPEGTRSRTGKLIKPRYGMVRMIIDAFVAGRFEKLVFQPISIGYEKIIEGGSYAKEAMGAGEKKQESATALIKASTVLTSNYGRVYIEFAEPLSLTDYMARYQVDRDAPQEEALQRLTVRLAHRIMYDIAEVTPVTPSALAALVLLVAPGRGIGAQRMLVETGFLLRFLLGPGSGARLTTPLNEALAHNVEAELLQGLRSGTLPMPATPEARQEEQIILGRAIEHVIHQTLLLLKQNNLVEIREVHDEKFYGLSDKQRLDLNYYRNNIVHFFVQQGILAAAIVRESEAIFELTMEEAKERSLFVSKLFKFEFFYKERSITEVEQTQFQSSFGQAVEAFVANGWIEVDEEAGVIRIPDPVPAGLEYMRTIMLPYLEPYHFVARHMDMIANLDEKSDGYDQKEFIKELLKRGELAHLQGEVQYNELLSRPSFENVLTLILDLGLLEPRRKEGKRGKSTTFLTMPAALREDAHYRQFADQIEPFCGRNRRRLDRML